MYIIFNLKTPNVKWKQSENRNKKKRKKFYWAQHLHVISMQKRSITILTVCLTFGATVCMVYAWCRHFEQPKTQEIQKEKPIERKWHVEYQR